MSWWHGGRPIAGDFVRPVADARSGNADGWVYVTPLRSLATMYAATCNGWIYEVEPVGPVEQDPGSMMSEGLSMRCRQARIIRRFRPSRQERQAALEAVATANRILERREP